MHNFTVDPSIAFGFSVVIFVNEFLRDVGELDSYIYGSIKGGYLNRNS